MRNARCVSAMMAAIVIGLCRFAGAAEAGRSFYVSPKGSDANPGTQEKPFATPAKAQAEVRALIAQGLPAGGVMVLLREGTYYLPQTLVFTPADSGTEKAPVTYAAYPGETPVLSGGARLALTWAPFRDGIFKARTPDGLTTDQLFVNGRRRHMARYPNYDPDARPYNGAAADAFDAKRAARWADPAGGFIHALHGSSWGGFHYRITGKTAGHAVTYEGGWQNNRPSGMHRQHRYVENIFEELDAPGEWYHDAKSSTLYYLPDPGCNLDTAAIEGVRLRRLVELNGARDEPVRHLHLRGFVFRHAARTFMETKEPLLRSDWAIYRGGAVMLTGTEDCSVVDCEFDQVGGNAVFVNAYNRRVTIKGCYIHDAGASGVAFVGDPQAVRNPLLAYPQRLKVADLDKTPGPRTDRHPADCTVEDSLIARIGRVEKQVAGVQISMSMGVTVRHCSIYETPRAGINIGEGAFGGHLIEHCDVFDTVLETGDHGSFNSWGRDRFWGLRDAPATELPALALLDPVKPIIIRNSRWRCDHGWDIDLDDGSSHYEIYNNLCLAGGIKLREGFHREVHNNILVDYTFCPHVWYPDSRSGFRHNILWHDSYRPAGMQKTDQGERIDYNLVHRPGAAPRPAETLRRFGGDAHSIEADAMFINPLAGDYRVQEGSPALKLGFKNFPMDQFGVIKPELKKIARTPPLPGSLDAARLRSGGWGRPYAFPKTASWLGATLKEIEDLNDMSAVGLGDRNGVLVVAAPDGSPAARFGLKRNDVIRAVNDKPVASLNAFAGAVEKESAAGPVTLKLWRNQAECALRISAP
jgi:hypothetical protein